MKNIVLSVVITLLVVAVIFFAWQYFSKQNQSGINIPESGVPTPQAQNGGQLSEQPNQAKYDEYLSSIYLGKMDIGKKIGTDGFPVQTNIFIKGVDQFCTMMDLKKDVASGQVSTAVYNTVSNTYQTPKTVFPMGLKAGGNGGCDSLMQSVGKYEYKLYIGNILIAVLPFEVK